MRTVLGAFVALSLIQGAALAQDTATTFTRDANSAAAAGLPLEDREDEDFAARGFIADNPDPQIRAADGRVVWDFAAYEFVAGPAPDTVNPSLWRHTRLLARAGLFRVSDRVYQVRGFDISNMTIVVGDNGIIVVDPLATIEAAQAALALARRTLGNKPVLAVIYSHSHADHFGGVAGVVDRADVAAGRVRIIAPDGFTEHAVSENIIAGPAMSRRATYQFGVMLAPGPQGQMSSGVGLALSAGVISLIPPTDTIARTGQEMTIDGVRFVFQMVPDTEAPSEMNFFLPDMGVLLIAEDATATMHNILTPRGALVRDSKAWADSLTEALSLYGGRAQILIESHTWPRFGADRVVDYIASERDAYKFLHDQTVRLMNQGFTGAEIADRLHLPDALARRWFNHGYYGTMSFNARAVYQRYMGFYDGVPAHLNPLPPEEEGRHFVTAMGGARNTLREAQRAFDAGDYRWAAEVANHLVFAQPSNLAATALLARAYTQMGYQAESAIWRNIYLAGALELTQGVRQRAAATQGADLIANTPTEEFFNLLAVRLNPDVAAGRTIRLNFIFPDRHERVALTIENSVLIHQEGVVLPDAQATITVPRGAFLRAITQPGGAAAVIDQFHIEGDGAALLGLAGLFDQSDPNFAIATP